MYRINIDDVDDETGELSTSWRCNVNTEMWVDLVDRFVEGLQGMGFVVDSKRVAEYLLESNNVPYTIFERVQENGLTEER